MKTGWRFRVVTALALIGWSCASAAPRGPPLEDPAGEAEAAVRLSDVTEPTWVWFGWEYADERGNLRGDGVARINPPDDIRLDLFASEGSLSAVLVDGELSSSGSMEDIDLPGPEFLYAMAGMFRPDGQPVAGFESEGQSIISYGSPEGTSRTFFLEAGRLLRVEERRAGSLERRIELTWGESVRWPQDARYRDDEAPNRVRWTLDSTRTQSDRFEARHYEPFPPR